MRRRSVAIKLMLLLLCAALLGFVFRPKTVKGWFAGKPRPINVVIIVADALRADRLGCYGYKLRPTSPRIDEFAKQGAVFEWTFAPLPMTVPSFASMFTSLYPVSHGIKRNDMALSSQATTLAEILRDQGWETAAVVGASNLDSVYNLNQGFAFYEDSLGRKVNPEVKAIDHMKRWERPAEEVNRLVFKWLDSRKQNQPFFLMMHYYDPHKPYKPPRPYDTMYDRGKDEIAEVNALYDGEVTYMDQHAGALFDRLKQMNLWDNTIVILTADHGEGLGDHNWQGHIWKIYDEAMRIPFIVTGPGIEAGKRIPSLVSNIDYLPGLLEYLNIPTQSQLDGKSFLPALKTSEKIRDRVLLEKAKPPWNFRALEPDWEKFPYTQWAIRTENEKFIWSSDRKFEFYDLKNDPRELKNEFASKRRRAIEVFLLGADYRARFVNHNFAIPPVRTKGGNDPDEALEALGYINR